jgi:hypothetical protein
MKHTPHDHGPVQGGAHGPNNLSGLSGFRPWHPSSKLLPRSRATCPLGRISASLEGCAPPRADLRLARGPRAPSPSSKYPPHSRVPWVRNPRTHSPDRSIKHSDTPRVPGSRANPHHAGSLAPSGNQIPVMFCQPSPSGHPWHCRNCAGRPVSTP